jgi:transposase
MRSPPNWGVAYATAHGWKARLEKEGLAGLRSHGKPGPDKQLNPEQLAELEEVLLAGAQAAGYEQGLWTLGRVRALIAQRFGVHYSEVAVWKLLRELKWSPQKPAKRAREADRAAIEQWKSQRWPQLVAEAQQEQRTIVFVDESGFSQRPARKRTWAPRGHTPILEFNFNWKRISAIAGVSFYELWFALHEGTIRAPQVIEFVKQLQARIGQKLLLIWDGLSAHGSRAVRAFLDSLEGAVRVERLPAYAPRAEPGGVPVGPPQKPRLGQRHARLPLEAIQSRPQRVVQGTETALRNSRLLGADRTTLPIILSVRPQ